VTPIRLVIVDDHVVFREGLRALLGRVDEIDIVGEAADTRQAIEVTDSLHPDVVLMDLHLPGGGGEQATSTCLQRGGTRHNHADGRVTRCALGISACCITAACDTQTARWSLKANDLATTRSSTN
jgi:CheY-like chemotaxis protein